MAKQRVLALEDSCVDILIAEWVNEDAEMPHINSIASTIIPIAVATAQVAGSSPAQIGCDYFRNRP